MKYYLIAGEASGDLHGSNLLKGLYKEDPSCKARFWGGPLMDAAAKEAEGVSCLVRDYKEGAVMGFSSVLKNAPKLLGNLRSCKEDILSWKPDAIILIDYPGFNFRIAEWAHKKGFKVFYYIAPKVWASREGRIKKLKKYVDSLFIVFPFEKEYFSKKGVDFIYEGNPIIDAIDDSPLISESRESFMERTGIEDCRYIALLAGSRRGEVSTMMPPLADFVDRMHALPEYSDYKFIIAGAPSRSKEDYSTLLSGREDFVKIVFSETYAVVKHASAAVINSGTASLEAAIIGTPQVVCYSSSTLSFLIARQIIRSTYISLGNLILQRQAFKEFIQYYATGENILVEIRRILEDSSYRETMLSDYAEIRSALGGKGASERVASAMVKELQ